MADEKRSAVDELFECLETGRGLRSGNTQSGIAAAREELRALRAENARMREALKNLIDRIDEHSCDDYGIAEDLDQAMADASAALGGRDD